MEIIVHPLYFKMRRPRLRSIKFFIQKSLDHWYILIDKINIFETEKYRWKIQINKSYKCIAISYLYILITVSHLHVFICLCIWGKYKVLDNVSSPKVKVVSNYVITHFSFKKIFYTRGSLNVSHGNDRCLLFFIFK